MSKLASLSDDIKDDLTYKVLRREHGYKEISQWLRQQHGQNISKTTVARFGKPLRDRFFPLIKLGMPIETIVKNRSLIDAMGVEQVKQNLLAKLAEKNSSLFSYLDDVGR